MDVWVTQVGTGQFYNLTRGRFPELVNPSVRTLGFSPDGALVTFWARDSGRLRCRATSASGQSRLSVGEPRPYLEGVAEFDWSERRLTSRVSHARAGRSDVVKDPGSPAQGQPDLRGSRGASRPLSACGRRTAPSSISSRARCRMPWTSGAYRPTGGAAERITHHNSRVSHPVFLNDRTLMYLATDPGWLGAVAA